MGLLKNKKDWMTISLITVISVAFGLFITNFLTGEITSMAAFTPGTTSNDYETADFYENVRYRREKGSGRMTDIFIIPTDTLSRSDINKVLERISRMENEPSVIAMDIIFKDRMSVDDTIVGTFNSLTCPVVMADILQVDSQGGFSHGTQATHFLGRLGEHVSIGAVNLPTNGNVIRYFKPFFPVDTLSVDCFAAAIARAVSPDKYDILKKRGKDKEMFHFPSIDEKEYREAYQVLQDPDELDAFLELAAGKILLFGDKENISDLHGSSVGNNVPGILFHVAILDTILCGTYVNNVGYFWILLLSTLLVFIFTLSVFVSGESTLPGAKLLMRAFQFGNIILLILCGSLLYVHANIYLKLGLPVLVVSLNYISADVLRGIMGLFKPKKDKKSKS